MVSHAKTLNRYRGRMAEGYEEKRLSQQRWHMENAIVEEWLAGKLRGPILDIPIGTGRLIPAYKKHGFVVGGIDSSEEMLDLAQKKIGRNKLIKLWVGDALVPRKLTDQCYATVISLRFLDLLPEEDMYRALSEMFRVAERHVVLTIRLGPKYVAKSNTATHDEKKFRAWVPIQGFRIVDERPIFTAGWYVMLLERAP